MGSQWIGDFQRILCISAHDSNTSLCPYCWHLAYWRDTLALRRGLGRGGSNAILHFKTLDLVYYFVIFVCLLLVLLRTSELTAGFPVIHTLVFLLGLSPLTS